MIDGLNQNQTTDTSAPINQPSSAGMVEHERVNWLIRKTKEEAYEKGRQEALASIKQEPVVSKEEIAQILNKELEKALPETLTKIERERYSQSLVNQHFLTVKAVKDKYQDFDDSAVDYSNAGGMMTLVQAMPNKEDVMHYLAKEPEKFNQINLAILSGQLKTAENMMRKFSESISENQKALEKAKTQSHAKAPLSQLNPSTTGVDGSMSYENICAMVEKRRTGR